MATLQPYPIATSHDRPPAPPEPHPPQRCDGCDQLIEGEPAGEGLYLWARGDEIRYERAPLCAHCAIAVGLAALRDVEIEEEESLARRTTARGAPRRADRQ